MVRDQASFRTFLSVLAFSLACTVAAYGQVTPSGYVSRLARSRAPQSVLPQQVQPVGHANQASPATASGFTEVPNTSPPAPPAFTTKPASTSSVLQMNPSVGSSVNSSISGIATESVLQPVPSSTPPQAGTYSVIPDSMVNYPTTDVAEATCGAPGCDTWGCDGGPSCGAAAYGACDQCAGPCSGQCGGQCYHWIDTLSLFVGVEGFKNGINRGESGSFGFQEGFNWGSPWIFTPLGMNTQIGFRGTQTDFHGATFTTEHRGQYFVTAGFFKRKTQGWQGGIVFDYLHDDWYTTVDLAQIRGELSLAAPTGNSLGFAFATAASDDETTSVLNGQTLTESWETQDYFTLFWEKQSHQCRYGKLRLFGGATGEADGIFGTQFKIPLYDNLSMESEFTYLIPNEGAGQGGTQNEAWNVAFQLVWYPARSMRRANYQLTPMFDVAGNGSMIARRK